MAESGMPQSSPDDTAGEVARFLSERRVQLPDVLARLQDATGTLTSITQQLVHTLQAGHKVLTVGNGGSAAEAQHFAAELVGRFRRDRAPYAAIALTTDTSILTALGNDYGFDDVFARQVRALARRGDSVLAFSTSGESENLIQAAVAAHELGARVISLTGARPNRLADASDLALRVPSQDTPVVQEIHLMVTHLVCGIVEQSLFTERGPVGSPDDRQDWEGVQ